MVLDVPNTKELTRDLGVVRKRLVGLAFGAVALLVVVYGVAVRTRWGQLLDTTALRGRQVLSEHDVRIAQSLHTKVDIATVAILGGAALAVAFLRGRRRLALSVVVLCTGSLATTEILKRVLGRPRLSVVDSLKPVGTYPSGHTTIAMSIAVAAMFVVPRHSRSAMGLVGGIFAGSIGCSLLVTGSHRPSDIIGAAFVVTAWAATTAAFLLRSQAHHVPQRPRWAALSPWLVVVGASLLVAAFLSTVAVAVAMHRGSLGTIELGRAFTGAATAIYGTAILCTGALAVVLHDVELE